MAKYSVVSAKIPEEMFRELTLRIPEGERSDFIRQAILEKLQKTPRPDKIFELEQKVGKLEADLSEMRRSLTELEVFTDEKGKVNPLAFCIDGTDRRIIDYLLNYRGATTPELAEHLKTNRWHVLNRLRRIQKRSKKQLGRSVIEYYAGERSGKRRTWWINEDLVEI